jgi:hypothetical protein
MVRAKGLRYCSAVLAPLVLELTLAMERTNAL